MQLDIFFDLLSLLLANTPMYDESLDELKRTVESYLGVVREYPFLGSILSHSVFVA